jgi:D-alanine-D-alanine ligase
MTDAGRPRESGTRYVRHRDRLQEPTPAGILRPKGYLSRTELWVLGMVALVPLLTIALRVLALPGIVGPGLGWLQTIGTALDQTLSLSDVPPDLRGYVLYLLCLPTCALLVALTRLTLGIRVLGFRSILIAVGFHQSGIVPSLLLITVAVATIVVVRPWLRRIRLPYYARVSVVLCIVATTMVGALLAGPWMRSDVLWGVAYFPVIVLGMLAEGIAHTLDRDNAVTASWRAITTILLAFVIALVCWVPALRSLLLRYPELVLAQIVAIVIVSEYLDLRLLENWDTKVAGVVLPKLFAPAGAYKVAVVRNRLDPRDTDRTSPQRGALRSVQKIVNALRKGGHTVRVMEGDSLLLNELRQFFPPYLRDGAPEGIVLNLAHGMQGDARTTHVPALLEMLGVAYAGPTPLGHAIAYDKVLARLLMQHAGVPTPPFRVLASPRDEPRGLGYPLRVRPRHEPRARPRLVHDRRALRAAVKTVVRRYRQEAFVEEAVAGRHISVALLGNDPVVCLPLVELDVARGEKICPAVLDEPLADRIREHARATFRACGCRDYARIDVRVDASGAAWVLGVHTLGILARRGAFVRAGAEAGYRFHELVCTIIEVARRRCHAGDPPRRLRLPKEPSRRVPSESVTTLALAKGSRSRGSQGS